MQTLTSVKTAVLIATYNRPEVIEDTLSYCLGIYEKFNFDVYIFDSSETQKSERVIKKLQNTHKNLYYIRLCSYTHLDCKWLDMVRGKYLKDDYDYYYVCSDSNSLTEYSLQKFYPYLQKSYDIITLNDFAHIDKTTEYTDANEYFNSPNSNVGLWGGAIYNKRLFNLSDEEWNELIFKWFNKQDEYIGYVGFIFDRLSKLNDLKIVIPEMNVKPSMILHRSRYKKYSFWRFDALKLLAITYPKIYAKLPKIYTNKHEKLLDILRANFNEDYFWFCKRNKSFNLKNYLKHKEILDKYDPQIMNKRIFFIAILPKRKFFYNLIKKLVK